MMWTGRGVVRNDDAGALMRVPTTVRFLQVLLLSTLVVYVISLAVRGEGYDIVFEGFVANAALALCPLLCLIRVVRIRVNRVAFALLGFGGLMFTAGNIVYVAHVQYLNPVQFPTVADIGYLGAYPFFVGAVILLACSDVGSRQIGVWLDGLVGMLGVTAIGAAIVLHTTLRHLGGGDVSLIVGAAYPVSDLMLLSIIVGVLTLRGQWRGRQWGALASGLAVFAIGDIVYLVRLSTDSYVQGTFLDAFWLVGLATVSMSAWLPSMVPVKARIQSSGSLAVTIFFSVSAIAVLAAASSIEMPIYAVAIAASTLFAGLLRTAVAFHQVRHLAEVRYQAITDDLTGLPNRRAFVAALEHSLEAPENSTGVAVLLVDLDRFKEVNDVLGHVMGDRLLIEVGSRLALVLRPGDVLARLGGDEFGLVLPGVKAKDALVVARRVSDALEATFMLDDLTPQIGGSIGVAMWPLHSDSAQGLLQCADVAMYAAKSRRSGVELYDAAYGAAGRDRIEMAKMLRIAMERDQFVLHYQPKLDLLTDEITGVEALVRWQHPTLGLLHPDAFLPIAEQIGCLELLTRLVLAMAIDQARRWHRDGQCLTVAVNLSASNLDDDALAGDVAKMLLAADLPSSALNLEITETMLMGDMDKAAATLDAIDALGITLSVDDFGTGFSSLTYLRDLPVKQLKIDRSFITDVTRNASDAAIVKSTIDLAHALGLKVVAEGVEDEASLTLLRHFGCDEAQGFYLCTPQPAARITVWMHRHAKRLRRLQPGQTITLSDTYSR